MKKKTGAKSPEKKRRVAPSINQIKVKDVPKPKAKATPGKTFEDRLREGSKVRTGHFPIVGVGASAGGLEAFSRLLENLPVDTGMAFVLVQHLDPARESALPSLLARKTGMTVCQVSNNLKVKPNHVYVIPPNARMAIFKGVLKLQRRGEGPSAHHSVDFFLQSLAADRKQRAIGVILSGTATDGTLGLESIKVEGGITFAQNETATHDSMPRSAINAGCVDLILAPEDIAKELARISQHPYIIGEPLILSPSKSIAELEEESDPAAAEQAGAAPLDPDHPDGPDSGTEGKKTAYENNEASFRKILLLLRQSSGTDFSLYKSSTVQRRVTRRVVLNKFSALDDYAKFLRGNGKELQALYEDVLINVTSFFRNPEAFEALRRNIFPQLVTSRREEPVRLWVLGCSSGQEAYSLAIALLESADNIPRPPKFQIFATDLNEVMLERARVGLYPKAALADVPPERLRRFFTEDDSGFRVSKAVRDMVVFARQNLINDPPFCRMDMITCRNLLIYLDRDAQKRIIPTFHYALKPGGYLFLGASETVGPYTDLFECLDRKNKIYTKKLGPTPTVYLNFSVHQSSNNKKSLPPQRPSDLKGFYSEADSEREADRLAFSRYVPPSVLIDSGMRVLQFRGDTSPYLKPPTGRASFDLLKMAHEQLLLPLRAAIIKAKKEKKPIRRESLQLHDGREPRFCSIEVVPLKNLKEPCFVIFFEEPAQERPLPKGPPLAPQIIHSRSRPSSGDAVAQRVSELELELSEAREFVQSIQEQAEAATEELQASNEEVTSTNEELQSINEELETSKEELESSNEELQTVNDELAHRNDDLNRLNSDLVNFQSTSRTAIVLLARNLTIRRFTTIGKTTFNLTAADLGGPIGRIRHNLNIPDLEQMVIEVIDTLREQEREVQDKNGRWYSLRVHPYLSSDNKIDGAILVLTDVDILKRNAREISEAHDYAEGLISNTRDPLIVLTADLHLHSANEAFFKTFQLKAADVEGQSIYKIADGEWDIPPVRHLLEEIIPDKGFFNGFELKHDFKAIGPRTLLLNARLLKDPSGTPHRILLGIRDLTEIVGVQKELRRSEMRYRRLFEAAKDGVLLLSPKEQRILDANPFMGDLLGRPVAGLIGLDLCAAGVIEDVGACEEMFRQLNEHGYFRSTRFSIRSRTGKKRDVEFISNLYREDGDQIVQCNVRDITERTRGEEIRARLAAIVESSDDAIISKGLDGTVATWNIGAEKLYGYKSSEMIGHTVDVLVPPERKDEEVHLSARLKEGSQIEHFETVHLTKEGRRINVSLTISPIRDQWNKIVGAAQIAHNITQRKLSEEKSRHQAMQQRQLFLLTDALARAGNFETIYDVAFDAFTHALLADRLSILLIDEQGGLKYKKSWGLSEAYQQAVDGTWEWDPGAVDPPPICIPDIAEKRWTKNQRKAIEEEGIQAMGIIPLGYHGKLLGRIVLYYNQPHSFTTEEVQLAQTFATQLSFGLHRQAAEKQLRIAQIQLSNRAERLEQAVGERTKQLSATNKQLEAFVYSIAHDLRAPLRSMQGFSTMLLEDPAIKLSDEARDFASRIVHSAEFMNALLLDLLAFSRLSQQHIELAGLNLEPVVKSTLSMLEKDIQEKNARVEVVTPLPEVKGHEATLNQLFGNLIGNALKFSRPETAPAVRVRAEDRGEFVRVWVEDNGIGIAPEYQEQIFRLFNRLNGETYPGTGVGLAIVQKAAERMGGRVGVESTPGNGSRFWFDLRKP